MSQITPTNVLFEANVQIRYLSQITPTYGVIWVRIQQKNKKEVEEIQKTALHPAQRKGSEYLNIKLHADSIKTTGVTYENVSKLTQITPNDGFTYRRTEYPFGFFQ